MLLLLNPVPPHASMIAARREKQDAQAAAAAAQAQMVSDVAAARAELAAAQRQARAEVEKASAAADSRMRDYVDKFRDQVRSSSVMRSTCMLGSSCRTTLLALLDCCKWLRVDVGVPRACVGVTLVGRQLIVLQRVVCLTVLNVQGAVQPVDGADRACTQSSLAYMARQCFSQIEQHAVLTFRACRCCHACAAAPAMWHQVRSREEELMNLGSLHTATKAAADKRITELEGRVSRLLEANRWARLLMLLGVAFKMCCCVG